MCALSLCSLSVSSVKSVRPLLTKMELAAILANTYNLTKIECRIWDVMFSISEQSGRFLDASYALVNRLLAELMKDEFSINSDYETLKPKAATHCTELLKNKALLDTAFEAALIGQLPTPHAHFQSVFIALGTTYLEHYFDVAERDRLVSNGVVGGSEDSNGLPFSAEGVALGDDIVYLRKHSPEPCISLGDLFLAQSAISLMAHLDLFAQRKWAFELRMRQLNHIATCSVSLEELARERKHLSLHRTVTSPVTEETEDSSFLHSNESVSLTARRQAARQHSSATEEETGLDERSADTLSVATNPLIAANAHTFASIFPCSPPTIRQSQASTSDPEGFPTFGQILSLILGTVRSKSSVPSDSNEELQKLDERLSSVGGLPLSMCIHRILYGVHWGWLVKIIRLVRDRLLPTIHYLPVVLPPSHNQMGLKAIDSFDELQVESLDSMQLQDRARYWRTRYKLDNRLESLLSEMRNDWFTSDDLNWILGRRAGYSRLDSTNPTNIVLVLDRRLIYLPWEWILSDAGPDMTCFTRSFSLPLVLGHLATLEEKASRSDMMTFNPHQTYYVLNPEANLSFTQQMFQPLFDRFATWRGVVGREPTVHEVNAGFTNHDLFIYLGHGNGSRFLLHAFNQGLSARAAALVLGCSSGKPRWEGRHEPYSSLFNHLLAGCPFVAGLLWDVTDRDMDRFTLQFLRQWLFAERDPRSIRGLGHCLAQASTACKLKHLVGKSVIVYGVRAEPSPDALLHFSDKDGNLEFDFDTWIKSLTSQKL
ncbi:hypothetical protein AHF37_02556 [Paragonimus kellicotti]|nr:hypothetical protein AHF37_02556 [Paragonimus kellicotti]